MTTVVERVVRRKLKRPLGHAQALLGTLGRLRFEGRHQRGTNMRHSARALEALRASLSTQMAAEEERVFPFLRQTLPKFDPALRVLLSEHRQIREKLREVDRLLSRATTRRRRSLYDGSDEVYAKGLYLGCLIRGHLRAESRCLYGAVARKLSLAERRRLVRLIEEMS